jgi:hypothetical protein
MSVAGHYRKKLEKDDIKRLSKEVAKKLVRGDYKAGRVKDPTAKLSSRHEKTVKNYVKEFMDKAVKKKEERDKLKATRKAEGKAVSPSAVQEKDDIQEVEWDDDMMDIQKDLAAAHDASPTSSLSELKRKREVDEEPSSPKKSRMGTDELASVPPPPPPPPSNGVTDGDEVDDVSTNDGELGTTNGITVDAKATPQENGYPSPMQLATPSTNGSHQPESGTDLGNGS